METARYPRNKRKAMVPDQRPPQPPCQKAENGKKGNGRFEPEQKPEPTQGLETKRLGEEKKGQTHESRPADNAPRTRERKESKKGRTIIRGQCLPRRPHKKGT